MIIILYLNYLISIQNIALGTMTIHTDHKISLSVSLFCYSYRKCIVKLFRILTFGQDVDLATHGIPGP